MADFIDDGSEEDIDPHPKKRAPTSRATCASSKRGGKKKKEVGSPGGRGSGTLRPFEFMKLAPELRDQIYGYLIDNAKDASVPRIMCKPASKTDSEEADATQATPNPTKKTKSISSFYHGLSRASRQIGNEFRPLLEAVKPTVVNIFDVYEYLDVFHLPANAEQPDVRTGSFTIDTHFEAADGIDILPLLYICSQSPDLRISFLSAKVPGSKKPAAVYFPGIVELFSTYTVWEDLIPLLDLQEIRLCAKYVLTSGAPQRSINLIVAPIANTNLVKRVNVGPATRIPASTIIKPMLSWATELIYRSGLCNINVSDSHFRIHCDFGVDGVTWAAKKGGQQRVGVTVELYKGGVGNQVLMKPKPLELEARPSASERDGKMWRMFDCGPRRWADRGP
jgi:hypothetical protein